MTRHQQLKNEARRAEHRSDWRRAIELYKEAIRLDQENGSASDVGVYNRVGDLYLRLGDVPAAVDFYEEAADRYGSHGLHTSAIALCNKILRIAPDRHEIYGRLARLHAATGLLAEARSAFLRFAERMREQGRLSDALETVQALVDLTGDEDLRTDFADQLADAGLEAQAIAQLRLAYEARVTGGRSASAIRDRILAIDPEADPIAGEASPPPRARSTPEPLAPVETVVLPEPAREPVPPPVQPEETTGPAVRDQSSAPVAFESGNGAAREVRPSQELEPILQRFRSQVNEIVEDSDHAVHYDLGVAYMGMGLLSEAIGEFQLSIQSPGLMEASHALLGECIRARAATPSIESSDRMEETGRVGPTSSAPDPGLVLLTHEDLLGTASPGTDDAPAGLDVAADTVLAMGEGAGASEVVPVPGGPSAEDVGAVPDEPEDGHDVGDLADMLFQARLAQHRVRRAADEGDTDHAAHLDLGLTYERIGLLTEAVRDLVAAAEGKELVARQALDALERVAANETVDVLPVVDALKCLLRHGRGEAAETAGRDWAARSGVSEVDRLAVLGLLPDAAALSPERESASASASIDSRDDPDHLEDLEAILSVIDASTDGPAGSAMARNEPVRQDDLDAEALQLGPADPQERESTLAGSSAAVFGEAEGLREAGRVDEAAAHYYRALEMYERDRDALSALRVADRLLGLRPDDVVLHHQRTEFAIMTNDRELLTSAYLDLAACLRRQNGARSARSVYSRILDLEPDNAEARAGIASLDADELARERQRAERRGQQGPAGAGRTPSAKPLPASEFDELFEELREGEAEEVPDYESHHELGIAFRQMQMWEEAAREFKQAVQGVEDPLPSYELLGEALIRLRRYEEARRTLSTAAAQPGPDAEKVGVLFHLGVAHLRAGDASEARRCLERVVSLDPDRAGAVQLLSTLSQ